MQSPMQIAMNYMINIIQTSNKNINLNQQPINNNNRISQSPYTIKMYYKLFYLYQQQLSYGYTPTGT